MKSVAILLLLPTLALAQSLAIAYGYDGPSCTGEVNYLTIWDARCTNDQSGADSSRYFMCNGTTFVAYVPCDKKNCESCNPALVPPNACDDHDNTVRRCGDTLPSVPTGWYIMKTYTQPGCTSGVGFVDTYNIWSPK